MYNLYLEKIIGQVPKNNSVEPGTVTGFMWYMPFAYHGNQISLSPPVLVISTCHRFSANPPPNWWNNLPFGANTTLGLSSGQRQYSFDFHNMEPIETVGWQYPNFIERYYIFRGQTNPTLAVPHAAQWCASAPLNPINHMQQAGAAGGIVSHHTLTIPYQGNNHQIPLYGTVERYGAPLVGGQSQWSLGWIAPIRNPSLATSLTTNGTPDPAAAIPNYPGCTLDRVVNTPGGAMQQLNIQFLNIPTGPVQCRGVVVWIEGSNLDIPISVKNLDELQRMAFAPPVPGGIPPITGNIPNYTNEIMKWFASACSPTLGQITAPGFQEQHNPVGTDPLEMVYLNHLPIPAGTGAFNPPYFP